jgi:hypothetical protein
MAFTTLVSPRPDKKVEIHILTGTHIRQNYYSGHYDRTIVKMTTGTRGDPDVKNGIQGVFEVSRYSLNSQSWDSVRGMIG